LGLVKRARYVRGGTAMTGRVVRLRPTARPTWSTAAEAFLERRDLASRSRKAYGETLRRLGGVLGDPVLAEVTGDDLHFALQRLYRESAPNSWNQRVAVVR